jgi:uncharacterized protein
MLTLDDTPAANLIRAYGPEEIVVNRRSIRRSCLVTADRIELWGPSALDSLAVADLEPIFALGIGIVLLAAPGRVEFPSAKIRAQFGARRIGFEVMELGAACRTFNVLVQEGRSVAGAFLLPGRGEPEEDTGRESFTNQPTNRS